MLLFTAIARNFVWVAVQYGGGRTNAWLKATSGGGGNFFLEFLLLNGAFWCKSNLTLYIVSSIRARGEGLQ